MLDQRLANWQKKQKIESVYGIIQDVSYFLLQEHRMG